MIAPLDFVVSIDPFMTENPNPPNFKVRNKKVTIFKTKGSDEKSLFCIGADSHKIGRSRGSLLQRKAIQKYMKN